MPFTAAHPAIILPLIRRKGGLMSATGLVAGSIAPDFEYFFKLSVDGTYGHTLWGILYFNLPVALMLSLVFHGLVKSRLLANLPDAISERFSAMTSLNFFVSLKSNWLIFAASAMIGAASHIFWDNFTHNSGYFVQRLAMYDATFISFLGTRYPLFFVLQHLSTILGLVTIALYIYFMPRTRTTASRPSGWYWVLLVMVTAGVTAVRFWTKPDDLNLGNAVVTIISGCCIGLIVAGVVPGKWIFRQ